MCGDKRKPPDDENHNEDQDKGTGDGGELSNVPVPKDNWVVAMETAEPECVPFMLAPTPVPGYFGLVRYAGFSEDSVEG